MEGPVKKGRAPRGGRGVRSGPCSGGGDGVNLPDWVEQALESTRHGTYFESLGLGPSATVSQVRDAWKSLVAKLDAVRPLSAGSPELARAIAEIEAVGEDAFAVLTDPDLRLAYRRGQGNVI